ncbi:hypothetical protein [Egbenema bharatensis]|uniref:hypothetical protein n=1 Tax=Egbenema bharatensis TaxID=3463334 RepID=UPI003A857970
MNLKRLFQKLTAIALGFVLISIVALSYGSAAQAGIHTPSENSRLETSQIDRTSKNAPQYLSENEQPKQLDSYMVDSRESSIRNGSLNDRAVSADPDAEDLGERINERLERAKDAFGTATDAVVNQ